MYGVSISNEDFSKSSADIDAGPTVSSAVEVASSQDVVASSQDVVASSQEIVMSSQEGAARNPRAATLSKNSASSAPLEHWNAGAQAMVRVQKDGMNVHADMVAGPTGFLVATWPSGEEVATKVPNLRVAGAGMSVSAIASTFKKPSSSPNMNKKRRVLVVGNIAGGEEDRAQSSVVAVGQGAQDAAPAQDWTTMYYKRDNAVGIREKKGRKRQLMSICSNKLSRDQVEAIAGACIQRLRAGSSAEATKAWGIAEVAKLLEDVVG